MSPAKKLDYWPVSSQFWDYITKEDLEFSVGIKPNNWEVKELLPDNERRASLYPDSEYASSMHRQRTSSYGQKY